MWKNLPVERLSQSALANVHYIVESPTPMMVVLMFLSLWMPAIRYLQNCLWNDQQPSDTTMVLLQVCLERAADELLGPEEAGNNCMLFPCSLRRGGDTSKWKDMVAKIKKLKRFLIHRKDADNDWKEKENA
jgi:hypothetical protein